MGENGKRHRQGSSRIMEDKDGTAGLGLSSDWAGLPDDCLINILSGLTLENRWTVSMFACKSWFTACKDPSLNSLFDLEECFESSLESPRWWTPDFERKMDSMLRSVISWSHGCLTEIRTRHCSDHSINFAAQSCPNLQVLSIKSSPYVTDASMAQIASQCPMLRELDISYCYQISGESLALIGMNCPNLKVLKRNLTNPSQHVGIVPDDYLNACPQDGDVEADAIVKFMPQLEHLEIGFPKLSVNSIASIYEGCSNLEHLDMAGCISTGYEYLIQALDNRNDPKVRKKPLNIFLRDGYCTWTSYEDGDLQVIRFQPHTNVEGRVRKHSQSFSTDAALRSSGLQDGVRFGSNSIF